MFTSPSLAAFRFLGGQVLLLALSLLWTTFVQVGLGAVADEPKAAEAVEGEAAKAGDGTGAHNSFKVEFVSRTGATISSLAELVVQTDDVKMFLTPDGQMWEVRAEDLKVCEPCAESMVGIDRDQIFKDFKRQMPDGFNVHKTGHFVLIYNTSDTYAKWVGNLYEQLYRGFHNYFKGHIELEDPRFPLVAIVLKSKEAYLAYAEREIGEQARKLIGYYHPNTNRVVTYDMTGIASLEPAGSRLTPAQLTQLVKQQQGAERTVATIVHEAVHQLAHNTGLQKRFADNPAWVSEGLATFIESPDGKGLGWTSVGKPNVYNYNMFIQYRAKRPADSLTTLICDDARFENLDTAVFAYGESWALTYFLSKKRKDAYIAYIKELSQLDIGVKLDQPARLKMFTRHFGKDMQALDREFLKFMNTIRVQ